MTQIQQAEFEILKVVTEICDRLDIPYFLVCGSALGAAKYHGFIPWDDDVDIGIFREDYERFLCEAPQYLPEHLFLQNHRTDRYYPHIFAKVRNSATTYIEKSASRIPMNHGIYIDIFPLDGYPENPAEQKRLERKKKWYKRLLACTFVCERSIQGRIMTGLFRLAGVHKRTAIVIDRYERMIKQYGTAASDIICNHGNWQGTLEYASKSQYGDGHWTTFEGLRVRIPQQYDAYLTQKYGNWREDPPKEKQIGHHFYEICDLSRPYDHYLIHHGPGSVSVKSPD